MSRLMGRLVSSMPAASAESQPMLANPFWHSLLTEHAPLSTGGRQAKRYKPGYIPFAGLSELSEDSSAALAELHDLLEPGEAIWIAAPKLLSLSSAWSLVEVIACVQMLYLPEQSLPPRSVAEKTGEPDLTPDLLTSADVPEMLELKEIAFPGFYGPRAPSLGTYYGLHVDGRLIAMAGERLVLPGLREVSAVCTHPEHRGRGYAELLIVALLERHQTEGLASFLHAAAGNDRAIRLYERLGFVHTRSLLFHQVRATGNKT